MEHMEHDESGNTKPTRRCRKHRKWVFTLNNWTDDEVEVLRNLERARAIVFQSEVGEETGTSHLPGYIEWESPRYIGPLKELLPRAHWEQCRDSKAAIAYCQKADTYDGQIRYVHPIRLRVRPPRDLLAGVELYPWQEEIISLATMDPDDVDPRKIYWYWSESGRMGKSAIVRHILIAHPEVPAVLCGGAARDMACIIRAFMDEHDGIEPGVIFVDIPRKQRDTISYAGLEQIKNGVFSAPKYESRMIMFRGIPQIIVFANRPPERGAMSEDRWVITKVDQ